MLISNLFDHQYSSALLRILTEGTKSDDRTGVGTLKVFDVNFSVDLRPSDNDNWIDYLPALSLRKVFPRSAFEELAWYLRGSTDVKELNDRGIHIWDGHSSREYLDSIGLYHLKEGFIGKSYGYQFRNANGVDQFKDLIDGIRSDPEGRRHIITLWNVKDLKEMALVPCAHTYDFMVEGNNLHLKLIQRSGDMILGVPANIMIAAFLLRIVCDLTGYIPGFLAHSITNAHIYSNHIKVANKVVDRLSNSHNSASYKFISPRYNHQIKSLDDYISKLAFSDTISDIQYNHEPAIPKSELVMAI